MLVVCCCDGLLYEWLDERMGGVDGWMDVWVKWMDGWMDGWMRGGCIDGFWLDGWTGDESKRMNVDNSHNVAPNIFTDT